MTVARLAPEQRDLLDLVRAWARTEVAPRAAAFEAAHTFPRELFAELGRMDVAGLGVAEEHGGSAQPSAVSLRVVEEIARAFLALGMGLSVHWLATWAIERYAAEDVRKEVVPLLASGSGWPPTRCRRRAAGPTPPGWSPGRAATAVTG